MADTSPPGPEHRRLRREVAISGHTGDPDTATEALDHPDWRVRVSALRAATRHGVGIDEILTTALSDSRAEVRAVAVEIAAMRRSPGLLASLDDPDARVVEVACWALGEREPTDRGAVEALTRVARDHDDPLCRESAVAALGAIGDHAGLAAVLAGLGDKPAVRRRAVVALAAFDGPEVDAAFVRARQDRDRQVRDAVEDLLGPA